MQSIVPKEIAGNKTATFLYLIGLLYVLKASYKVIRFLYRLIVRRPINLINRYGENSWAIVTGSSDGIGKQIALQLAERGFNIVLVARNRAKLEAVAKLVRAPRQTRIVVADFSKSYENGFFDAIAQQVDDLDVSVLVNNVGIDVIAPFETADEKLLQDNIIVNTLPTTILTRKLVPRMLKRNKPSAVLNVASLAGKFPHPFMHVYAATKAYIIHLSDSLRYEFPKLDVLVLNPSEVSTNMIYNREPDIMTITPESCARQALNDLGFKEQFETYGHWNHKLQYALYSIVSTSIYVYIYKNFVAPLWFKERAEGEKKRQEQLASSQKKDQ